MALTATISKSSREHVQRILGMFNVNIVSMCPCKPNIDYSITTCCSGNWLEHFSPLLCCIQNNRINTPRTLVFCRTMNDCSSLYQFFKTGLGKGFVEPTDAPDCSRFHLVDMFHRHTDENVRTNNYREVIHNKLSIKNSCMYNIIWIRD